MFNFLVWMGLIDALDEEEEEEARAAREAEEDYDREMQNLDDEGSSYLEEEDK